LALAYSTQNNILHENVGALKCRRPMQNVSVLLKMSAP